MTFGGRASRFLLDAYNYLYLKDSIPIAGILFAIASILLSFPFPGLRIYLLTAVISLWLFLVLVYLNYRYRPRLPKMRPPSAPEVPGPPPEEKIGPDDTDTARQTVVNTGFSLPGSPDTPTGKRRTLACGTDYLYWVETGPLQEGSIEFKPTALPALPAKAALTVTLAGFSDGLITVPGADIGEIEVQPDGSARVTRQPLLSTGVLPQSGRLDRRLFFPVRTPPTPGTYRMRCNIYHGQVLIQSREIRARVTPVSEKVSQGPQALRSVLDYNLSGTLDGAQLSRLGEHRLSILLNESGKGSHSLHLFGTNGKERWKNDDIRFQSGELQTMVEDARKKLRKASWGHEEEWEKGWEYLYGRNGKDIHRLKKDICRMAWWGREFYESLWPRMAGNEDKQKAFEEALAAPGLIQLAMKESAQSILPLAMVYDYPLDPDPNLEHKELCPTFTDALKKGIPLQDTACFQGRCPSRGNETILCPSGFWGFRHAVGMPISVPEAMDAPSSIPVKGKLRITMAVSTTLDLLDDHVKKIRGIRGDAEWFCAASRNRVMAGLWNQPHLVYFYCHGLTAGGSPYLQIGTPEKPEFIYRTDFGRLGAAWRDVRPLVFINGCHTTATDPLGAYSLSQQLVVNARSAGAIGTEISVFEPLAAAFAEECLRLFLNGESIGWAIRNARLKILADGNPLGLVYIPFVVAGLQLEPVPEP